jgi:hypothetical protein
MARKRGNPNWGKFDLSPVPVIVTSFEEIVKKLRLKPADYVSSPQLKDWARRNKDHKYVPSDLLEAWNIDGEEGF